MPEIICEQGTRQWHDMRLGRITASVAAACLNLHPHMSAKEAWRRALGTQKEHSNQHTQWGHEFEPKARRCYEIVTGNLVTTTSFWVHPEHDWLGASPDGLVDHDGGVEIKCPVELPKAVPIYHRIQMLVCMIVTQRPWWDYFAWTMHSGTFLERVHLQGEAGLVRRLEAFYREYVLTNTEPPRKKSRRRK